MNKKYALLAVAILTGGFLYKRSLQSMDDNQQAQQFEPPAPQIQQLSIRDYMMSRVADYPRPDEVGRLDLSSRGITSLDGLAELADAGYFEGVRRLDLSTNLIKEIDPGTFSAIPHLERINLRGNLIQEIKPNTFFGLYKLKSLRLTGNRISVLHGVPNDEEQEMFTGRHTEQRGSFTGLTNLTTLYLNKNQLAGFEEGVFRRLRSLEELTLDHNQLSSLPAELLKGLVQLRVINLTWNELKELPEELFTGLTDLEELNVCNNIFAETDREFKQRYHLSANVAVFFWPQHLLPLLPQQPQQ